MSKGDLQPLYKTIWRSKQQGKCTGISWWQRLSADLFAWGAGWGGQCKKACGYFLYTNHQRKKRIHKCGKCKGCTCGFPAWKRAGGSILYAKPLWWGWNENHSRTFRSDFQRTGFRHRRKTPLPSKRRIFIRKRAKKTSRSKSSRRD